MKSYILPQLLSSVGVENNKEYTTMLEAVIDKNIFTVYKNDDGGFTLNELCDGWYAVDITPEQLIALATAN